MVHNTYQLLIKLITIKSEVCLMLYDRYHGAKQQYVMTNTKNDKKQKNKKINIKSLIIIQKVTFLVSFI